MIFSIGVGSEGAGAERWTIRIPINISPWSRVSVGPEEKPLSLQGHRVAFYEDKAHELYILEVYDFPSEDAAHEALPGIQAGLVWAALRCGIALPFPRQAVPVSYNDPPMTISRESDLTRQFLEKGWDALDGDYPGTSTVVKPEHKRLSVDTMGGIRVVNADVRDENIVETISEAMRYSQPGRIFEDAQLRLVLNIYSSSFFQFDDSARFFNLVTILEVLNPRTRVPKHVENEVEKCLQQVRATKNSYDMGQPEYEDFELLQNRLGHLKTESIRQGIRSLVADKLASDPDIGDPMAVAKEAADIYDDRSRLVHNGYLEEKKLKANIQRLMYIVPRVLRGAFLETLGRGQSDNHS